MPIRHTAATDAAEEALARRIAGATGLSFARLPELCPVDYSVALNGSPVGWAEFKIRTCSSTAFPDLMLDASKLFTLVGWARGTSRGRGHLRAWLFVHYLGDDVVKWTPVDHLGHPLAGGMTVPVGYGGREDRGDPADWDLVAHLPARWFSDLADWAG